MTVIILVNTRQGMGKRLLVGSGLLALLLMGAMFGLTACANGTSVHTMVVEVKDTGYIPAMLEVPAGEAVKLILKNTGTQEHQWGIQEIGLMTSGGGMSGMSGMSGTMDTMHEQLQLHIVAAAGTQNTLEFTPTKPDRYAFFCPMPGHTERGTLIVKGSQ